MTTDIGKHVGRRLRELREARGLTQAQLASLLGKSIETISNFERGKVLTGLLTLEKLAGHFGVEVGTFFSDTPAPQSIQKRSLSAAKILNAPDLLPEEDLEIVAGMIDLLAARRRKTDRNPVESLRI